MTMVIRTPLFWLLFGAGFVQRVNFRFLKFVIYAAGYLLISLLLSALVKWLMSLLVSHGLV